jgi:hypothetical protein
MLRSAALGGYLSAETAASAAVFCSVVPALSVYLEQRLCISTGDYGHR